MPIAQLGSRPQILAASRGTTRASRPRSRRCRSRPAGHVGRDVRLALGDLAAVVVAEVDHTRRGSRAVSADRAPARRLARRSSAGLCRRQDDVTVGVAARVEDRRRAAPVDAGEGVRLGGGTNRVDGHLDVAVSAVLEADGIDSPDPSWRWIWLSVVRAPIAPHGTASAMYWGVIGSRNSQPTGSPLSSSRAARAAPDAGPR